ncbi:hypothetical protein BP6252_06197 [Coleophoma cylindrospora]|uniref:Uncharacterized protein n=1 Tax=Coleophoma cylindrospora TaxID=1849047 RepID=A0A3D8RLW2_9HELO|nr:hypothetical protein BP6252_06197 [Coleophoma cylindrospora]
MGRPRKRKLNEARADPGLEMDSVPVFSDSVGGYDNTGAYSEPYFATNMAVLPQGLPPNTKSDEGRAIWSFGEMKIPTGPPIQFGQVDFGDNDIEHLASPDNIIPADATPALSAESSTGTTDSDNSFSQNVPCSCLASMYLALASLQQLPPDIKTALYTVRSACSTAQRSIWCLQCGSVMLSDKTPPIESFQNTMLLGTILPVIANGYRKLLEMIDNHTKATTAAGQTMTFELKDYGGIGYDSNDSSWQDCSQDICSNRSMQPAEWRSTVRALLRMDIYGHEQGGFKCKGLKDIVDEMETRQQTRHLLLDAHTASGTSDWGSPEILKGGHFGSGQESPKLCLGEKTATCLEIIKIAKYAIDNLVIA